MAVTITAGEQVKRGGVFQTAETLAGSTGTAEQSISLTTDVTNFSGSTATVGFLNDKMFLAGTSTIGTIEGMEKMLLQSGTGRSTIRIESIATGGGSGLKDLATGVSTGTQPHWGPASATGVVVFTELDDFLQLKYVNSKWRVIGQGGATQGTST